MTAAVGLGAVAPTWAVSGSDPRGAAVTAAVGLNDLARAWLAATGNAEALL